MHGQYPFKIQDVELFVRVLLEFENTATERVRKSSMVISIIEYLTISGSFMSYKLEFTSYGSLIPLVNDPHQFWIKIWYFDNGYVYISILYQTKLFIYDWTLVSNFGTEPDWS